MGLKSSEGPWQRLLSEAGRSYVYNVARDLQLDSVGNGLDADGVKLYCGQMGKNVADRAIQVHLWELREIGLK